MSARIHQAADEASALEEFHRRGWTDGLPVVIPTAERVAAMILGGGLDPDIQLGEVGPAYAQATVEKVAINAVMAGCLPDHFPVVIAAVRAVCDEIFDLGVMQSTTHALAPVIIVNGPARADCGRTTSRTAASRPQTTRWAGGRHGRASRGESSRSTCANSTPMQSRLRARAGR